MMLSLKPRLRHLASLLNLAFCVSVLLATTAKAQGPTNPLSLAEAIAWGVDNNLSIAGQRLGVEVAARNNNWVTAGRAPLLQATLGVNNGLNSQNNPASFLNGSFYSGNATAGLQLNYTLFNGYQVRFDRSRLGQLERVASQQVQQLIESSVFEVANAYYTAQLRDAEARLARRVLRLSADRRAFQELRRAYGQGQSIDLLQARTAYLTDSLRVEQAALAVDNAERNLYLALDAEPGTFAERNIGDTLVYAARDWTFADVAGRVDSSASVQLLQTQQELSLTQSELARAALQPSIDLSLGLQHTRNAFKFLGETGEMGPTNELRYGSSGTGQIGGTAAYTLWDAGQRRRNVANAITQERVAQFNVSNARRDATQQARSLLATYESQRELLDLQSALIDNASANLALAAEQLKAGTINSFNYRQLQVDYFNAVQARITAVYNLLVTDLNLRRLTGELVEG